MILGFSTLIFPIRALVKPTQCNCFCRGEGQKRLEYNHYYSINIYRTPVVYRCRSRNHITGKRDGHFTFTLMPTGSENEQCSCVCVSHQFRRIFAVDGYDTMKSSTTRFSSKNNANESFGQIVKKNDEILTRVPQSLSIGNIESGFGHSMCFHHHNQYTITFSK